MKHKIIIIANILFGFTLLVQAQQTPLTAGAEALGAGGSQSYSIGQLFYTWNTAADEVMAQGVQPAYINLWEGYANTNWGLPANWLLDNVPADGEDIVFNLSPHNHLHLDQTRTVNNIINTQPTYHTVLNGNQLNLNGSFNYSNGALLNGANAGSTLSFSGSTGLQQLSTNELYNQELYNLDIKNANNVSLNGSLKLAGAITSASGRLNATASSPTIVFAGAAPQTLDAGVLLDEQLYNITSDNANAVTINTALLVTNNTVVNADKKMIVSPNNSLTIDGQLQNNGGNTGFILASSAAGTASLLHNTNDVQGTAQRYVNGAATAWHLLSSPITGQAIHGSEWTPTGTYGDDTGYDMYVWDEATSCWIYNLNTTVSPTWTSKHPQANFISGRGYLYALQEATPTKHFVGSINNGVVSQNLTNAASPEFQGFNLIGNPYPSSIDWKLDAGFDRSMLVVNGGGYDTWIWSNSADNYGVYNSAMVGNTGTNNVSRYIAPMVGFFVKAANSGTFNFNNTARVHTGASDWMKAKAETHNLDIIRVSVELVNGKGRDEVLVFLGSPQNENGARKVYSDVKTAPSLSLPSENYNFTIRYITNTYQNKSLALNFKAGINGDYSLKVSLPDSIKTAVLEDKQNGMFVNIIDNSNYNFSAKTTDILQRFLIHFGTHEDIEGFNVPVYMINNKIIVDGSHIRDYQVMVYDAAGRSLYKDSRKAGSIAEYPLAIKGVYIVLIEENTNRKRTKVIY